MILQVSWFVDVVPQSWALTVIFSGVLLGLISLLMSVDPEISAVGEEIPILIIGVGSLLGIYNFHSEYPLLFVGGITFFSRYFEGLAAIRLYQKALYVLREGDLDYEKPLSFPKRILLQMALIFCSILVIMTSVFLVISGHIEVAFSELVRFAWTAMAVSFTAIGLSTKLKIVTDNDDTFHDLYIPTLVLIVAGAELYNYGGIESEIYLFGAGVAGYSIGYWRSVSELLKSNAP